MGFGRWCGCLSSTKLKEEDAQPPPQTITRIPVPKPPLSVASDTQVLVSISAVSTSAVASEKSALYTFLEAEEAQLVLQYLGKHDLRALNGVGRELRRVLHARVTKLTMRAPSHCLDLVSGKWYWLETLTYKPDDRYLNCGQQPEDLNAESYKDCKVCRNDWVNILVFWARGFYFLKELHLSGVQLEAAALADIGQLGWKLEILDLSCNLLGAPGVKEVVKAPWRMHLKKLDLSRNHIDATALEHLSSGDLPNLTSLTLGKEPLTAAAISYLSEGNRPQMSSLHIEDAHLNDDACQHLLQGNWPSLKTLSLGVCDLKTSNVKSSQASKKWQKIGTLNVHQSADYRLSPFGL